MSPELSCLTDGPLLYNPTMVVTRRAIAVLCLFGVFIFAGRYCLGGMNPPISTVDVPMRDGIALSTELYRRGVYHRAFYREGSTLSRPLSLTPTPS